MNKEVEIKILKQSVATKMESNFSKYSTLYKKSNSKKREKFFQDNSVGTGIYFSIPNLDSCNDHKTADIYNAKLLYKSLSHLTLSQASDVRIWYYLAGTYFYDYVYNYVGAENVESLKFNKTNVDNKPPSSFLTSQHSGISRTLYINYLSRLWWAAYISEANGDFKLLKVFTNLPGKMTITRKFFNNKIIAHSILKALYKYYEINNNEDFSNRHIFEVALKEANVISSSQSLDFIDENTLKEEIYSRILKIL